MNVNETLPRYAVSMPLQAEFILNTDKCGDNIFRQIKRQGNICLYSRTGLADGRPRGFELFKVKTVKAGASLPGGLKVEADYEQYPSARMFGKSAASICGEGSEARALELFTKWAADPAPETKMIDVQTGEVKVRTRKSVNDNVVYVIPAGEFTQAGFAEANGMELRGRVYGVLQAQVTKGLVKSLGLKKVGKGRPTAFFVKATPAT
jgi:hypothetical protein